MLALFSLSFAFSSGGGEGLDASGSPFLQSCDAISICEYQGNGLCPPGMDKVAPPERSSVYAVRTGSNDDPALDPTSYTPGELIPIHVLVTRRLIRGKANAGLAIAGNESAKYIGLLLYAVREGDVSERKVGRWEIPLETPVRFWTPPDVGGCDKKALMHAGAEAKAYEERFLFRAPPAGAGALIFRALVKQGDTNRGAFYWPGTGLPPQPGVAGGDLRVVEAPVPPEPVIAWLRGSAGQTCTERCAEAARACDEAELARATSANALRERIERSHLCKLPFLGTCDRTAHTSGIGDGLCWYHDAECGEGETLVPTCAAVPSTEIEDGLRFCPCRQASGRRLSKVSADLGQGSVEDAEVSDGVRVPRNHAKVPLGASPLSCPGLSARSPGKPTAALFSSCSWTSIVLSRARELGTIAILAIGALLVALAIARRGGGPRGQSSRVVALTTLLASEASSHNWINSPKTRVSKVSTVKPCVRAPRSQSRAASSSVAAHPRMADRVFGPTGVAVACVFCSSN